MVSLSLFVWIELTIEKPLIRLRLLARRNFGFGTIAATMLGFALFGSVYILPAYLGQAQGYNAEQIGRVLAWTGLPQLILIPLVPRLMQRFDIRYIAFTGLMIFAYSCFMNTAMSLDYAGDQLWIPNIVRAIGQAMVLTPLTSVTTGDIAPQDAAAASGISNMLRNLGGAIGTAVLATVITKREQFHSNIIGQSVTLGREEVRNRIAQMTATSGAWRHRCRRRKASGDHRARQCGEAAGAGAGLHRYLRRARHRAGARRCHPAADQAAEDGRRRGSALSRVPNVTAPLCWVIFHPTVCDWRARQFICSTHAIPPARCDRNNRDGRMENATAHHPAEGSRY